MAQIISPKKISMNIGMNHPQPKLPIIPDPIICQSPSLHPVVLPQIMGIAIKRARITAPIIRAVFVFLFIIAPLSP
jgi:hypothetical protein